MIENPNRRMLAPSFDHASSLGFQLTDTDREDRLATSDRLRTVAAYVTRAKSRFEGRIHPMDAAIEAFNRASPAFQAHWFTLSPPNPRSTQT